MYAFLRYSIYIYIYIYIYDDDEIRCISHRYKVMTLLVSARKINNTTKIQQPWLCTITIKLNKLTNNMEVIITKYKS